MRSFTTGIAAIALVATGAFAQGNGNGYGNGDANGNGNGQGKGNGGGGPPASAQIGPKANDNGSGNGNGNRVGPPSPIQAERGSGIGGGNGGANAPDRGRDNAGNRGNGKGNAAVPASDRGPGRADAVQRGVQRVERNLRGDGNGNGAARNANGNGDAGDRALDRTVRQVAQRYVQPEGRYGGSFGYTPALVDGCPPGLAKKTNGCLPPGEARRRSPYGSHYEPGLFGLLGYDRGDYYYDDGYLLRRSGSAIAGYIPLLGGALAVGNSWPGDYGSARLPDYYVDYYNLGGPQSYRYADDVIYRVDPNTSAIQSIAALLTGDQFTVGQPLPQGYDVYNVPYAYRDRYYDTPEANYRYSDGYVYRVDPQTQLIAAAIDLLL